VKTYNMKSSFFTVERASVADLDLFTVKSKALNQRADVTVYKPEGSYKNMPVVVLLHGVYGSHWAWSLKANVYGILQQLIDEGKVPPMLLVMPSDGLFQDGSGYLPHKSADYEKWIVEDVPLLIKESYEEATNKSPFFIAGLSMGGYGALRLGAKYPKVFKAFSGLSSIINFDELEQFVEDFSALKSAVRNQENVLEILLENKDNLNPFRFDCGTDDTLFTSNLALHELLELNQIPHEFYQFDGGHSWEYWSEHIGETLIFFGEQL
jgi:putative tributyrin esterase